MRAQHRRWPWAVVAWAVLVFGGAAQADPLTEAYQKEYAFLEAEKQVLQQRLKTLAAQGAQDEARQTARIVAAQRQVLALGVEAETLAGQLQAVEREAERASEGVEGLDGLVTQMSRAFSPYEISWPPVAAKAAPAPAPAADGAGAEGEGGAEGAAAPPPAGKTAAEHATQLASGFEVLSGLLRERAQVRRTPGAFFLADGRQVQGTLVRIGDVAVYGVAAEGAGALTPAGGGRLKLDPVQGEATARALAQGAPPPSMGVFLYESLASNHEVKQAKTPLQIVRAGGAIAWVIVGLGGFTLLLMLLRVGLLALSGASAIGLARRTAPLVDAGRFDEAAAQCARARGAAGRVLSTVAARLHDDRDVVERLVVEKMLEEEGRVDRFGTAVLVTAAVAPLLGLLGTVTGMISTFDVITEFGTGNPKLLSGGISEALITTELGLVVAIPALLAGNLLNGWAERIKTGVEQGALILMNRAKVGDAAEPPAEAA